jgi:hypothetical protein
MTARNYLMNIAAQKRVLTHNNMTTFKKLAAQRALELGVSKREIRWVMSKWFGFLSVSDRGLGFPAAPKRKRRDEMASFDADMEADERADA